MQNESNHSREPDKLRDWLEKNRIASHSLLDSLDSLGAQQPIDLLDLTDTDIVSFQPPFLKKLEFVRFKRSISALKDSIKVPGEGEPPRHKTFGSVSPDINTQVVNATVIPTRSPVSNNTTPFPDTSTCSQYYGQTLNQYDLPAFPTYSTAVPAVTASASSSIDKIQKHGPNINVNIATSSFSAEPTIPSSRSEKNPKLSSYKLPPLPSSCPEAHCSGTLSVSLGKRKNKYLKSLEGPDFRWVVSCSACPKKWHACHFLCGHLQKISSIGSSDIIRHEQGRFNRWLKKIKPPCSLNPRSDALKKEYKLAKISYISDNKLTKDSDSDQPSALHNDNDNTGDKSSIPDEGNPRIGQTSMNETHPSFDNEFRSMLGSLDKDTLDVSGVEVATMDDEFLTTIINGGGCPNAKSSAGISINSQSGEEPPQTKVKVEEELPGCPFRNSNTADDVNDLCDEIVLKCTLRL